MALSSRYGAQRPIAAAPLVNTPTRRYDPTRTQYADNQLFPGGYATVLKNPFGTNDNPKLQRQAMILQGLMALTAKDKDGKSGLDALADLFKGDKSSDPDRSWWDNFTDAFKDEGNKSTNSGYSDAYLSPQSGDTSYTDYQDYSGYGMPDAAYSGGGTGWSPSSGGGLSSLGSDSGGMSSSAPIYASDSYYMGGG